MGDIVDTAPNPLKRKRKNVHVAFNDEEDIINPGNFCLYPDIGSIPLVNST